MTPKQIVLRGAALLLAGQALIIALMLFTVKAQAADIKTTMQATATVTYRCTLAIQGEVFIPCRVPSYPEKILKMEESKAVITRKGNYYVITY